ncbi:sce7726 family protein [Pseudoalteromonas piscicida]|uniref:sce7726 family protein n=1 Tax=Pseudoalteromonas piscicida TaxID=43662 RepID=UPI0027E57F17|nr:sce7726 family protein [Pseudoalteromonas piscicida]WMO14883.1 sce7726 family protein [Pseudoalteromonas piscicida]
MESESFAGIALARVFSASIFNELANKGYSPTLKSLSLELDLPLNNFKNLSELFEFAYRTLSKVYRNEYLYKNTIANKILLGRHSINTAAMLSEFRVANSKADAVILNGTIHIYEIKTELDSLERLDQQIEDYLKFAEFVSVVADGKHIPKLEGYLPEYIGLIEFTNKDTLRVHRKAISNVTNLDLAVIFDSLRKDEYVSIINAYYDYVPKVPNTLIYKECKVLFLAMPLHAAYSLVLKTLKLRANSKLDKDFVLKAPKSLKVPLLCTDLTKKQINNLSSALGGGII